MTRFPLRRLRLRPGDEQSDAVAIELEPFELGGQRYLPVPHEVEAALTIAQATTGLDLRLAFDVRLHGPCMRCLADAVVDVHVDAREYHAADAGCGRRAPERVRRRRRPARALRAGRATRSRSRCPTRSCTRRDCAGLCPVCGKDLNVEPHTHDDEVPDPRWSALEELRDRL